MMIKKTGLEEREGNALEEEEEELKRKKDLD